MQDKQEFIVIGAGPVGLCAAMLLHQKGHPVTIYEKRNDPRLQEERGRSINLALSDRGFRTLQLLGLEDDIKANFSIPMKGRMVHDERGNTQLLPYSLSGKTIFSVSRNLLNHVLLDAACARGIGIHFSQRCLSYNPEKEILHTEKGSFSTKDKTILGCDGAFSPMRSSLKVLPDFKQEETKLYYGYKELTIPPSQGEWQMEKNALHIWPRKSFMLIALPNTDGSFTCTLFLPMEGSISFQSLGTPASARQFFEHHFPDALQRMDDFENDFFGNPTSSLFMETCTPWHLEDKLLLLGDAAHAIVPFYGQGLNAGLEDVRLLNELLEDGGVPLTTLFSHFQKNRKPDTDAIGQLALQNFIEMRDLVIDKDFLMKRKLESKIKAWFPDSWNTQYELVTFSHVPYRQAQHTGIENEKKLDAILKDKTLAEHIANEEVTQKEMDILSQIVRNDHKKEEPNSL